MRKAIVSHTVGLNDDKLEKLKQRIATAVGIKVEDVEVLPPGVTVQVIDFHDPADDKPVAHRTKG